MLSQEKLLMRDRVAVQMKFMVLFIHPVAYYSLLELTMANSVSYLGIVMANLFSTAAG